MRLRPPSFGSTVLAAALLAGCAAPRDDAPAPVAAAEIPAAWQGAAGTTPVDASWWRAFGDPVLAHWVELALAANADLGTAVARVRQARGEERVARASLWPTLDASANATRARSPGALGGASLTTSGQPLFQAAYELDLFGRVAEGVRAAQAGTQGALQARDAAALAVAATAASGYLTLRLLDARLEILEATLASRAESLRLARDRARVGYTSELEWRQSESEYEATAQQVPAAQAAIARQEHALALLAGLAPGPVARGAPLAALTAPAVPGGLPSELLRRRPDIAQAESALAAADAQLAVARAQFLPSLRLTATAGSVLSTALPDPVAVWSIGASVLAPIFSAGRLEGQAEAAAGRRDEAAWAYRGKVLNALREVEDGLAAVARLREQRVHLQAQRAAVAEALRHATNRYRAGYASYLEQLDAERSLLGAELALAQVQGDELVALVGLEQAMGGGWPGADGNAAASSR